MYPWIKKNKNILLVAVLVAANLSVLFYIFKPGKSATKIDIVQFTEGKQLAVQYCQGCHMVPDPSLLTKEIWATRVMPNMGPFLGITSFKGQPYQRAKDVDTSLYFPSKPVIDSVKWQQIIDYYTNAAPAVMPPQQKDVQVIRNLPFFSVELPPASFYSKVAMSVYVKIDTTATPHKCLVSEGATSKLWILNDQLKVVRSVKTNGPVVDLDFQQDGLLACIIGKSLAANNAIDGNITPVDLSGQKKDTKPLFDKLARPCKISHSDFNGDGKIDYVISQFGNLVGNLSWMENTGDGNYKQHILRNRPGAISTIVNDYNGDGLPDIWSLFGQGEEGVFLYTNKGKGLFEEKQVLRFPPSYGSVSFDLVDFNKDGYLDIIYTAGDNGDFTDILKPYHGVYIFLNDGKNNFRQKYFYPINGCFKAIAKDFDGDGNIDIATISFFPSSLELEESFIYLQNKGDYHFQPYSLPIGTTFQKGITMDAGDLNGDGKPDLILGNGFYSSDKTGKYTEPLFIVLKNISSGKKLN